VTGPASPPIVIQARAGSTRLPGKVLLPFGGRSLLHQVVERASRSTLGGPVWVATSAGSEDDQVAAQAGEVGARVFRGDLHDVLGRFVACVAAMDDKPSYVVRICADRPLICPDLVDEAIAAVGVTGSPDYISNSLTPSWPDGLDVEVVAVDALREAAAAATSPYEREHVTPYIYRRPERFRLIGLACPFGNHSAVRVALDTEGDRERLRRVHDRLAAVRADYDHLDVLNLAVLEPELFTHGV
jgi:spore coat polysaccharide biosynthesis protein SpsF